MGHLQPVVGDADVADVALLLGLQHHGKDAVGVVDVRQNGGIVELEQVDVIRAEAPQALLNVGSDRFFIFSGTLGGDHHLVPDAVQGLAQLFLAVGVHIGGVEVVDAAIHGPADQLHRVRLGDPLDGQGAEGCLGDVQLRAAQSDFFHGPLLSPPPGGGVPLWMPPSPDGCLTVVILSYFSAFANWPPCDKIKKEPGPGGEREGIPWTRTCI